MREGRRFDDWRRITLLKWLTLPLASSAASFRAAITLPSPLLIDLPSTEVPHPHRAQMQKLAR